MCTAVVIQPSYIPWRGYFDLIRRSDVFVFYDDVQYDKHGWRNRNRVKTPEGSRWLTIPVHARGNTVEDTAIDQIEIVWSKDWRRAHLELLRHSYRRAPYYAEYAEFVTGLYATKPVLLADFTIDTTIAIARRLGITRTQFIRSSTLGVPGKKTDRLLATLFAVGDALHQRAFGTRVHRPGRIRGGRNRSYVRRLHLRAVHAAASSVRPGGLGSRFAFHAAPRRRIVHSTRAAGSIVISVPEQLPFNRPFATGKEFGYITEAIANAHLSGDGPFTKRVNEYLANMTGSRGALLTHSCTAALEMSAILSGVGPGDEVIMPSYTFVSTANAFVLRGATPVFVDVRADTLNLDERLVEDAITERTRAIVAVHYAGVACEMDTLAAIAQRHNLHLIEDAAQAVGSSYRGRPLGSFGATAALSFHETKNVISGEGGALLVNDSSLLERAEIIREKGTNRTRFLRGSVDKYTWVDIGSSYLPSEIVAAFLWAQLEFFEGIAAKRMAIWNEYHERLEPLEAAGLLRRPIVPESCAHNAHMYYVLASDAGMREAILTGLQRDGIKAIFHYVPLHSSPAGLHYGRASGALTTTERASGRLVRLPLFYAMNSPEIARVCDALTRVLRRN